MRTLKPQEVLRTHHHLLLLLRQEHILHRPLRRILIILPLSVTHIPLGRVRAEDGAVDGAVVVDAEGIGDVRAPHPHHFRARLISDH